jgi:hypothetical protein
VLLLYPIFRYLLRIALDNDPFSVDFYPFLTDFFIPEFILSFAYYSLTLWAIGKFGDDVNTWVVAHPNDSVAIVVAAVLVSFLIKISFSSPRFVGYIPRGESGGAGGTIIAARPKLTERDHRYTAAHEAGHALVYAALGRLPPGIQLVIEESVNIDRVFGYISGINCHHALTEKTFAEWKMLVLLAGTMGEMVEFGETTLGSEGDHDKWLSIARRYLANHLDGIYYSEPQNKFEHEHNISKLEAFQRKQKLVLEQLFNRNLGVFKELQTALLEKRTMGRKDLIPYLSRVSIPDDFPLPFGKFKDFKQDWPYKELGC